MGDAGSQTLVRQWTMLRSIPRSPRKVTATELANSLSDAGFSVSKRTIERDLHGLSGQFPLILDDRAKPYGWSWSKDAQFEFMPRLSSSQAVALLLAKAHLHGLLPLSMGKELVPLFDNAEKTLASSGWKDWHKHTAVTSASLALMSPDVSAKTLNTVQSGLVHKRCLTGRYRSKGNVKAKEINIHPLGLFSRGPVLYLVCTLNKYTDIRQLALHRLLDVEETAHTRRKPPGFNFTNYMATSASNFHTRGKVRMVCRFTADAAEHLRETPLSEDQQLHDMQGGLVEVRATVEHDERLRWWLLGFGAKIIVDAPASLRDAMRNEFRLSSRRYAGVGTDGSEP